MDQLLEVCGYLRDVKVEVRRFAAQTIAEYSANEDAQKLLLGSKTLIKDLCLLISDAALVAKNAYLALLHLSVVPDFSDRMLEEKIIARLMDAIMDKENKLVELSCMVLCNLTRRVEGCRALIQVGTELEGLYVHKLIQRFCMPPSAASLDDDEANDPYKWLASVFTNVSQMDEGRALFLNRERKSILYLLPFLSHPHPMRTRGVVGVLRNCCVDAVDRTWLLSTEVDVLRYTLAPLVRPSFKFSKKELEALPDTVKSRFEMFQALELAQAEAEKAGAPTPSAPPQADDETVATLVEVLCLLTQEHEHIVEVKKRSTYAIIRELDRNGMPAKETQERLVALALRIASDEISKALSGSTISQERLPTVPTQDLDLD